MLREIRNYFVTCIVMRVVRSARNVEFEQMLHQHARIIPSRFKQAIHKDHKSRESYLVTDEVLTRIYSIIERNVKEYSIAPIEELGSKVNSYHDKVQSMVRFIQSQESNVAMRKRKREENEQKSLLSHSGDQKLH